MELLIERLKFSLALMAANIFLGWSSSQKILLTAGGEVVIKTHRSTPKKNTNLSTGVVIANPVRVLNSDRADVVNKKINEPTHSGS